MLLFAVHLYLLQGQTDQHRRQVGEQLPASAFLINHDLSSVRRSREKWLARTGVALD